MGPGSASSAPTEVAAYAVARARVLDAIAAACARVGRDPAEVTLVAVSKTVPADRLVAAVAAGLTTFGENRVQEGEAKVRLLPAAQWHLIGPLQSNKARRAIETFDTIQSVDSIDLARRLDRLVGEDRGLTPAEFAWRPGDAPLGVYLQVNVDLDEAKAGFMPAALETALPELAELPNIRLLGLMTVGRLTGGQEEARPTFVRLRGLSERLRAVVPALGPGLSMGMSGDYPAAVEEGATVVRVGRALFGERLLPGGVAAMGR